MTATVSPTTASVANAAAHANRAFGRYSLTVKHWTGVKANGQGLLFWGGVGTGKTFAAACIANALTEQGIPVLMTNFSKILNSLSGMFSGDRNKYLASFGEFDLLIIDDLALSEIQNTHRSKFTTS